MSIYKETGKKRGTKNNTRLLDMTGLVQATSTTTAARTVLLDNIPVSMPMHSVSLSQQVKDMLKLTPSVPMLARPIRSFEDVSIVALCQNTLSCAAIYEEKYDGERLLCVVDHNTSATFYTRTLKPTAFPHEVALKPGYTDCVLDGERVYVDAVTDKLVPISDTGVRSTLRQCYRVFDVQYVNGQHMFATPLHERKRLLSACVQESRNVVLTPYTVCSSLDSLREAFQQAIENNVEGLIVKPLNTVYMPGGRDDWLKVKKLHLHEYKEEYDLYAHRALKDKNGLYGVLECGYYKPETSEFVHVCNVGSGISDSIRNYIRLMVDPCTGMFKDRTIVSVKADKITDRNRSLRHPSVLAFKSDQTTVDVSSFIKTGEAPSSRK